MKWPFFVILFISFFLLFRKEIQPNFLIVVFLLITKGNSKKTRSEGFEPSFTWPKRRCFRIKLRPQTPPPGGGGGGGLLRGKT